MCGICGIIRTDKQVSAESIESMKKVLVHRGPDDEGTYISEVRMPDRLISVGLGHRRLSIIDLSSNARQPLSNEDGQIWLTYNGEVYNYAELREELVGLGHVFKTRTDSEVIIHAYEQWGTSCLERFNGMFAFGLWDVRRRRMFLARDRLGIKPLYYFRDANSFIFASELKAILQIEDVPRELNRQSLSDYFSWKYIPAPKTIFKNIEKLLPGHFLMLTENGLNCQRYWDIRDSSSEIHTASQEQYHEQICESLSSSVNSRLISDVPLGVFLSGGFDSSSITAMTSQLSSKPIPTFTIGFDSHEYTSEFKYANIMSEAYSTEHHERILNTDKLVDLLDSLVWFADEPFADSSMIPTYLVSQLAKENVTVALSGDGADECFGGYPRKYMFAKRYSKYLRIPRFLSTILEKCSAMFLGSAISVMPETDRKRRFLKLNDMLKVDGLMRVLCLNHIMDTDLKKRVLHREIQQDISLLPVGLPAQCQRSCGNLLGDLLILDIENYLANDILTKMDRMSMANSLEVRVPFLDHNLVELAVSIPANMKIHAKTTKYILKGALHDILPGEILNRKKQGFGIPLRFWMKENLMEYTKEVLLDPVVERRHIFNHKTLEHLLAANSKAKMGYSKELWSILVLELWCRNFLDK
ncbi:MAG: asparagine synthase (glutamine-hydrolyzing) [Desulfobacteraceae bacterium]|nr:asparagine synthase (glutamine-hydrolyzing) [Desulfobacteraceae bacterium]